MTDAPTRAGQVPPAEFVPVEDFLEIVDPAPYLEVLEQRFGVPPAAFERYWVHRANRDNVWIVDRGLRIPARPEPRSLGFPFFYARMEHPRPTTAAAVRFGSLATRNIFSLEAEDLSRLIYRKEILFEDSRLDSLQKNGYVLLSHRGLILGLGSFKRENPGSGSIKSLLPRSWTARLALRAPDSLLPSSDFQG